MFSIIVSHPNTKPKEFSGLNNLANGASSLERPLMIAVMGGTINGEASVGKTRFIRNALRSRNIKQDVFETRDKQSDSLEYQGFKVVKVGSNNQTVDVVMLDNAYEQTQRTTGFCFPVHARVIVFNIINSNFINEIITWMKLARGTPNRVPVYLVATHVDVMNYSPDLIHERIRSIEKLSAEYDEIKGLLFTDRKGEFAGIFLQQIIDEQTARFLQLETPSQIYIGIPDKPLYLAQSSQIKSAQSEYIIINLCGPEDSKSFDEIFRHKERVRRLFNLVNSSKDLRELSVKDLQFTGSLKTIMFDSRRSEEYQMVLEVTKEPSSDNAYRIINIYLQSVCREQYLGSPIVRELIGTEEAQELSNKKYQYVLRPIALIQTGLSHQTSLSQINKAFKYIKLDMVGTAIYNFFFRREYMRRMFIEGTVHASARRLKEIITFLTDELCLLSLGSIYYNKLIESRLKILEFLSELLSIYLFVEYCYINEGQARSDREGDQCDFYMMRDSGGPQWNLSKPFDSKIMTLLEYFNDFSAFMWSPCSVCFDLMLTLLCIDSQRELSGFKTSRIYLLMSPDKLPHGLIFPVFRIKPGDILLSSSTHAPSDIRHGFHLAMFAPREKTTASMLHALAGTYNRVLYTSITPGQYTILRCNDPELGHVSLTLAKYWANFLISVSIKNIIRIIGNENYYLSSHLPILPKIRREALHASEFSRVLVSNTNNDALLRLVDFGLNLELFPYLHSNEECGVSCSQFIMTAVIVAKLILIIRDKTQPSYAIHSVDDIRSMTQQLGAVSNAKKQSWVRALPSEQRINPEEVTPMTAVLLLTQGSFRKVADYVSMPRAHNTPEKNAYKEQLAKDLQVASSNTAQLKHCFTSY